MQLSREQKDCNTIRTRETDGDRAEYQSKPPQVTVEAQRRHALVAPGDGPGVWLLMLPDGRQLTMRPKQLTDGQG